MRPIQLRTISIAIISWLSTALLLICLTRTDDVLASDETGGTGLQSSTSVGAVIVVGGRLRINDPLQTNIHYVTNSVYQRFRGYGYSDDDIMYLATDLTLAGVDGMPSLTSLREAITDWAPAKAGAGRPVTLYFMGHGDRDLFYLDRVNGQYLVPDDLDSRLTQFETAVPGVDINVIIDTSNAGSFITVPSSISATGRVILASTSDSGNAYATPNQGAAFSDPFIGAWIQDASLLDAFVVAEAVTTGAYFDQTPWVDGNGNGIPNEDEDELKADNRIVFPSPFDVTNVVYVPLILK